MKRIHLNGRRARRGLCAALLVAGAAAGAVAASSGTVASAAATATAAASNPYGGTLANGTYGEKYNPSAAVVNYALAGHTTLPTNKAQLNVALAALYRANNWNTMSAAMQAKALSCWKNNGCSTGTGGKLTIGEADGFGGNPARQLFKMEFMLQALSYPQIGKILYTDANLSTTKAISDVRSMVAQGAKVIVSYPDAGAALLPAYQAAQKQNDQVTLWSNATVGSAPTDYLTTSGTNLCVLGQQYASILNKDLPGGGQIALLGGTPGNPQSPAWQACEKTALNKNIKVVAVANTGWTEQGALQATSGIISKYPKLNGVSYDYGQATVGVIRAMQAAHKTLNGFVVTDYSNDEPLLCEYKTLNNPAFKVYTFVGLFFQGRVSLTAGMMQLRGASIPPAIIFNPTVTQISTSTCRADIPASGSPTALIPAGLQKKMFG